MGSASLELTNVQHKVNEVLEHSCDVNICTAIKIVVEHTVDTLLNAWSHLKGKTYQVIAVSYEKGYIIYACERRITKTLTMVISVR